MSEHLWPLLRLKADSDEELKESYRQAYLQNYVCSVEGRRIELTDWMGNRVHFNAHRNFFEHAFTEHKNYRSSYGVHSDKLDKRREEQGAYFGSRKFFVARSARLSAGIKPARMTVGVCVKEEV